MKKLIITGNIGQDAKVLSSQSGEYFATFSVAVSVGTKSNPKTDWVDVTCNGKLVDVAKNYVKKGGKILVEGFPTVNAYINKDNVPVAQLKLHANTIELLSRPEQDDAAEETITADIDTESIPF
jgi:single-strand DNA-binding protein